MTIEQTRDEVERVRERFDHDPGAHALALADRFNWLSTAGEPATVSKPDRTQELKDANPVAAWLASVTIAIQTEPGRVTVETTLVDPRGDDGSPEAQTAIAVCEATVALDSTITNVTVAEQDGSSWILFGHPSVPVGECGEV